MKFSKATDIVLMGKDNRPLPHKVAGYRSGPFTVHKSDYLSSYTVSVNGAALMHCTFLENAKAAAKQFAALPIDWSLPFNELQRIITRDKDVARRCLEIKADYSMTTKVAPKKRKAAPVAPVVAEPEAKPAATTTGIVKWFNETKGYGYLTVDGKDMFVHYTSIAGEGFKTLKDGETVFDVEVIEGPKGPEIAKCTRCVAAPENRHLR